MEAPADLVSRAGPPPDLQAAVFLCSHTETGGEHEDKRQRKCGPDPVTTEGVLCVYSVSVLVLKQQLCYKTWKEATRQTVYTPANLYG